MNQFEPIQLEWRAVKYVIRPDQILQAMRLLEYMDPAVTMSDMARWYSRQQIPKATLAEAYATLLRFAGATVSNDEVFHDYLGGSNAAVLYARSMDVMNTLFRMMVPPEALVEEEGKKDEATEGPEASSPSATS